MRLNCVFRVFSTLSSRAFVKSAVSNRAEPESCAIPESCLSCAESTHMCVINEVVAIHLFQYDCLITRREFPSPDLQTYRGKM